jgi:hypothetical protein
MVLEAPIIGGGSNGGMGMTTSVVHGSTAGY